MNPAPRIFTGGPIFDGTNLHSACAARFEGGVFTGLVGPDEAGAGDVVDLGGGILSPGYVDLQVNGGDGIMLGDAPSVTSLRLIAAAHRRLGSVRILPTLITDVPAVTARAIEAAASACAAGVPGIAGLHLEGPHLSVARKGAHKADLIRPMAEADLAQLIDAKAQLPVLKVTLAPESTTPAQVSRLAQAGIIVALGHSDADFDTCLQYFEAGATCVTHLFNAMSQLGNRAPGLVGAALAADAVSAGLIADGYHVHPAVMRAAWAAKTGPGALYLVSDAMAVAGTDETVFTLHGREISRACGRLRLADGTLAGADLDLTRALSVLVNEVGVTLSAALAAAVSVPARVIGLARPGLEPGQTRLADMIRIDRDLTRAAPLEDLAL
ncbi:MAG: N-acetylglucosamine-6-phosphate deacetylase [Pseudomonadota bacterium]